MSWWRLACTCKPYFSTPVIICDTTADLNGSPDGSKWSKSQSYLVDERCSFSVRTVKPVVNCSVSFSKTIRQSILSTEVSFNFVLHSSSLPSHANLAMPPQRLRFCFHHKPQHLESFLTPLSQQRILASSISADEFLPSELWH